MNEQELISEIKAYCEHENPMGSLANISAAIMAAVPDLNWVGFYLDDGSTLRLGPFQGRPACTEIAYSRGVCGAAFSEKTPKLVNDVHAFPDHIACDAASRAEVVVPLFANGRCVGVLDIDSPALNRFSDQDFKMFKHAGEVISQTVNWNNGWFPYALSGNKD